MQDKRNIHRIVKALLKKYEVPFVDPCDDTYVGNCGDCGGGSGSGITSVNENTSVTENAVHDGTILTMTSATDLVYTTANIIPIGGTISVVQGGAGQIIFAAGAGDTINAINGANRTLAQWAAATLTKTAENTYLLSGNITS